MSFAFGSPRRKHGRDGTFSENEPGVSPPAGVLRHSLRRVGVTPRWLLRPRKGRLIRCTVPGSTPNRAAILRTPGWPGSA